MIRDLTNGAEGSRFQTVCALDFSKTLSVHPAGDGYLFRAGEGEGGVEEDWYLNSITPLPVGSQSATPP